jgi:hypothetical protein
MAVRKWLIGSMLVCGCMALSGGALAQDHPGGEHPGAKKPKTAQDKPGKATAGVQEMSPEQKAMMEAWEKASALTENHKRLEFMTGEWNYVCKIWMDPSGEPSVSSGVAVTKPLFDGRYYQSDHVGRMSMPGPDGSMVENEFKGISITGFDNLKGKYVGTWIDNMGTGIMMVEGSYDPSSKAFTYTGEMDDCMSPGTRIKIREVISVLDKDKHLFEWFEIRDGKETRTMEITYTRKAPGRAAR